jgi:hypothetical protein
MQIHRAALLALSILCCVATACTLPSTAPTPTAIKLPKATRTRPAASPTPLIPLATAATFPAVAGGDPTAALTQAVGPLATTDVSPATFCADPQVTTLINGLKSALQASNGALLASLVSPTHGMAARLYRNGTVVNYDRQHAKFLFDTTFAVDWGPAPGSGQETVGPFHETIVPALRDVFDKSYTLTCNQVQVGGTTYQAIWPYTGINFYSVYYPGSQGNGSMDWHTWLLGMHYVNGKPYLYAIMQFKWEP